MEGLTEREELIMLHLMCSIYANVHQMCLLSDHLLCCCQTVLFKHFITFLLLSVTAIHNTVLWMFTTCFFTTLGIKHTHLTLEIMYYNIRFHTVEVMFTRTLLSYAPPSRWATISYLFFVLTIHQSEEST